MMGETETDEVKDYCHKSHGFAGLGKREIPHNYDSAVIHSEPLNPAIDGCWNYLEVAVCTHRDCGHLRHYISVQEKPSKINTQLLSEHKYSLVQLLAQLEIPPTPRRPIRRPVKKRAA